MIYIFMFSIFADAAPLNRISELDFNRSKVQQIYMEPGRQTLIDFPCHITRASVGSSKDVDVKITSTRNQELDLWLKEEASQSTNLIVRCDEAVFVFDIVPSRLRHQDYIKIVGSAPIGTSLISEYKIQPSEGANVTRPQADVPRVIERSRPQLVGTGYLNADGKIVMDHIKEFKGAK